MTPHLSDDAAAITLCAEGAVLSDAGDAPGALSRYRLAVELAPSILALHLIVANAEQLAGDTLAARATLRRAVKVAARPDVADDFTLGRALVDAGAGADAVPCFRRVRSERPTDATAAAALAAALRDAQRPDEAWEVVSAALTLAPNDPVVHLTAAMIRHDLADYPAALQCVERSLLLRPEHAGARLTRGYIRHLLGNAHGGWSDFEARALPTSGTTSRAWDGASLHGRSIVVLGEQGVGDQLQFLRFVRHPALQAAARCVITCQPEAVSLLREAGFDAVPRHEIVTTDFHVPLLSLPLLLGVGESWRATADDVPYLQLPRSAPRTVARVRRAGLVWAGNPAHRNDAVRSIPASAITGLLRAHHDITFVSMQHGVTDRDLPRGPLVTLEAGDWRTTAEQLCTLDVLITVDTGIAHLAGALGVPVWILVSHVPDWRWGASGMRTAWYRSARLFRQPERGDWSRVLTNVSAALSGMSLGPA